MVHFSFIITDSLSSFGSTEELRDFLALLKACGYEGVELNLTEPPEVEFGLMSRWLTELGLVVPAFLTGAAYGQGLCLSSPDKAVRYRTVARLICYLDTAKAFDALLVIGLLQGLHNDEADVAIANGRIVAGLREVASAAQERGVKLVLEPVNHLQVGFNNSVAEVLEIIEAVASPALLPMVDTIHMNIEERSLVQPILDCGPALSHVHLCESNGSLFGTGNIDFAPVLAALEAINYDGFASVKVYRGATMEEAARTSIDHLLRLSVI